MYLTLEVVSPQAASLGAQRKQVVGAAGLTIGRTAGNDWVIPDPYISKLHARISHANGAFFIESLGRNPVAIGGPQQTIPAHQPRPLRNGDRFFIDQYEVLVSAHQGEPPGAGAPRAPLMSVDDPFGVQDAEVEDPFGGPPSSGLSAHPQPAVPDVWNNAATEGFTDTAELDPLAALGGRPRVEPELPPVNWQQAGPLGDHFQAPSLPLPPSGADVPDNWDQSQFSTPAPRPAAAVPKGIPDNWERSVIASRPAPQPPVPRPAPATEPVAQPRTVKAPAPRPSPPLPSVAAAPRRASAPPAPPEPHAPPESLASVGLAELLQGAGLDDREVSPEIAQELGQVLRIVVQGVMDVLQARSNIKSQFRLPTTRIKASENNPLKLSPNVESALHTLLVQRNPGYLPTAQAFEDAFNDIRHHQVAMLEGVRAAFRSMLESFSPQALEEQLEPGKRAGRLGFGGGKSRYQELYADWYARLGKDADDTFRRLFGDVFAEAYEKQLERLKRGSPESGKN